MDHRGGLALDHGAAIERLANGEGGVEQTWSFMDRPAGAGDLTVRVEVGGAPYAGTTASGLHFRDAATGVGVRYGEATWVDGRGRRTGVRQAYAGGEIVMTVPAAVLEASSYPAVLDPVVSPEVDLDVPVPMGAAVPVVATDGALYLAAWSDARGGSADILATRVTPEGVVLDPTGIPISVIPGNQKDPTVAFDGTSFVVVWQHCATSLCTGSDLFGARVSPSGSVLDPDGFAVSTAPLQQAAPAATGMAPGLLVAWEDYRSGTAEIRGARIDPNGTVLDPDGILVASDVKPQRAPAVAHGDGMTLVVFEHETSLSNKDVRAARVGDSGTSIDASALVISAAPTSESAPAVGSDGTDWLVTWRDCRNDGPSCGADIYGARVDANGSVLDPAGILIASSGATAFDAPVVAHDGSWHLVAWKQGSPPYGAFATRVSSEGVVLEAAPIFTGSSGSSVACRPAECLVTGNGYALRIDPLGTVLDPQGIVLTEGTAPQRDASVGFDGGAYLVAWVDGRAGKLSGDLYGTRVDASGAPLDPAAFFIAPNVGGAEMAFGGGVHLLTWASVGAVGSTIWGTRVTPSGVVLDPAGFQISKGAFQWGVFQYGETDPTVASDGSGFFVLWEGFVGDNRSVYGTRVGADGTLSNAVWLPHFGFDNQFSPALAFDGTDYLAVWSQMDEDGDGSPTGVMAARFSTEGTILDPKGFVVASSGTSSWETPAIACGTTSCLALWGTCIVSNPCNDVQLRGARIGPNGTVLDAGGFAIGPPTGKKDRPAVTFDGSRYLVVWEQIAASGAIDLRGTWVDESGNDLVPAGMVVSSTSTDEHAPALSGGGAGASLVAYHRFDPDPPYAGIRVRARLLLPSPPGVACASDGECATGHCVDQVCCDGSCGGADGSDCIACSVAAGAASDGTCGPVADATSCTDGDVCTLGDACSAGSCVAQATTVCAPADDCHVAAACDPAAGCSVVPAPDGTSCPGGTCAAGVCVVAPDAGAGGAGQTGGAGTTSTTGWGGSGAAAQGGSGGAAMTTTTASTTTSVSTTSTTSVGSGGQGGSGQGGDANGGAATTGTGTAASTGGSAATGGGGAGGALGGSHDAGLREGGAHARPIAIGGGCGCEAAAGGSPGGALAALGALLALRMRRRERAPSSLAPRRAPSARRLV